MIIIELYSNFDPFNTIVNYNSYFIACLLVNLKVFSFINMIMVNNIIIADSINNTIKISIDLNNIIRAIVIIIFNHLFHNFIIIININMIIKNFHNFIIKTINYFIVNS